MKAAKHLVVAAAVVAATLPPADAEASRLGAFRSFGNTFITRVRPRVPPVRPWRNYHAPRTYGAPRTYRFPRRTGRATGLKQLNRQRQDARVIKKGLRLGKRGLKQHFGDAQKPEDERFWKKHNGVYHNENDRRTAVERAWAQERELVRRYGRGTRRWTEAEKRELMKRGKVRGYEGHHRNPVVGSTLKGRGIERRRHATGNPALARDPDNIAFLKSDKHDKLHAMSKYQHSMKGKLTPRDALARVYEIQRKENVSAQTVKRARDAYRNIAAERLRQANRMRTDGSRLP